MRCITTDGRQLTGLIAAETATSVTLKRADNATDTVLRIDIDQLKSTGLSLMPEGMEKQIDQAIHGRPARVFTYSRVKSHDSAPTTDN